MCKKRKLAFLLLWLMIISNVFSQEINQKLLIKKSYKELREGFDKHYLAHDTINAILFADTRLAKAKIDGDSLKIAESLYLKLILDTEKHEFYHLYDTIIAYSKNLKNQNYPTNAYFDKGVFEYRKQQYKSALDNFSKAAEFNKGRNREYMKMKLNVSISKFKIRIDKNKEALDLMKDCFNYSADNNFTDNNHATYFSILYILSDAYRKVGKLDSMKIYARLGLNHDSIKNDSISYYKFLMLDGVFETAAKKYNKADALLSNVIAKFEKDPDKETLASAYYFSGKNHQLVKEDDLALMQFKKIDSLYKLTGDIIPEHIDAYHFIRNYYRDSQNREDQLVYVEKLIEIDSVLYSNYKDFNDKITAEFDIPKLVEQKEVLIDQLKNEKAKTKTSNYILIIILAFIFAVTIYQYQKQVIYKKRFLSLIENDIEKEPGKTSTENDNHRHIDVPQEVIDEILEKLLKFEENRNFVDTQLTLTNLANKIGTNSSYLSKVVNHYKKESFSSYLKKLRIQHGFHKLKSDPTFRKYTIKAIAKECGFKTAESFSKTFYEIFGIYPSYFIKKLEQLEY